MRTISRILNETDSGPKTGLNEIQTRTLIAAVIVLILVVIYCLLWLLMRRCGRSVNCQSNLGRSRTRSRAYEHVLQTLPVIPYAPPSVSSCGPAWEAEACAICLAEYEEGESVRVLPRCKHFLHMECIDEWLLRSFKCPICRALVTESKVDHHGDDTRVNEDRRIIHVSNVYDCPPLTSVVFRSLI